MPAIPVNFYDTEGIENSDATLKSIRKRAKELDIKQIVVATTTGQTALKYADALPEAEIVAVTMHAVDKDVFVNRHGEKVMAKDPHIMDSARQKGVKFYTGVHPLGGAVSSALSGTFGGYTAHDIISEMLKKLFSTGTKVAIECALMAADAGYLDMSKDIIAAGGYRGGADTAVVMKPAFSYKLFEMKVREFICFPRESRE
ncbi:pyruvate kinase alpha/beta domain-containing protein [Chitinispirillales bacterium ANBcel5]|uniref:pyruvate kinase alpha/beta domain-containing protein n=1 Tax=Cellulosispirillum alkaliphilum TaxID=3039283 RepID=UPI002A51CDC1|nr:pyruvate kinase alpha/beta domain-containing protein [Chitinispirillales bacterium ANBcel5]